MARGQKDVCGMQSKTERHRKVPTDVHNVMNKLSIIIGNCDLLIEKAEQGTEAAQRLTVIREAAKTIVNELTGQQEKREAKTAGTEKAESQLRVAGGRHGACPLAERSPSVGPKLRGA